jgi:subtilisin family serine protease
MPMRSDHRGKVRVFVAVLVLVLAGASRASAAPDAPSGATAGAAIIGRPSEPVSGRYIVRLRTSSASEVADTAARLAADHGGSVVDVYRHAIRGFAVRMSESDARALARDPEVAAVDQDGVVRIATTESPAPWHLDRVDQRDLPLDNSYSAAASGASVRAYVIDTGIRVSHQDFGGRAVVGDDEVGDGQNGNDCNGHGTHVAGILGGATSGVAKAVSLVSVRVLDCSGAGEISQVIAGVEWVTAHAIKPAVANMSLGGAQFAPLDDAVASSIASGITYTIAAGNSASDACAVSPSDVPTALTVGATDATDTRASFSNFGPCVKLFAPGVNVVSDWFTSDSAANTLSGTSMAAPVVGGIAALYLDQHHSATTAEVASAVVGNASAGRIVSPGPGSPNLLAFGGPLGTSHPGVVLAAAGSASTEAVVDRVLGVDPSAPNHDDDNFDVSAVPTTPELVPGDASCAAVTYSSDGASGSVVAPDGSDAGRDALRTSVEGSYPDAARGAGGGCIDIARSDRGPRPVAPGGDRATFEYFAFGLDAVSWATPSLQAPPTMTLQQLRAVFSCAITDWSQLPGGANGPIQRFMPTATSSTAVAFAVNVLGFDPSSISGPGCPPVVVIASDSGRQLLAPTEAAAYQRAILPYSASSFVFQANNSTNPSLDLRAGLRLGGIAQGVGSSVLAARWTGSAWLLNNATIVGGRNVADATTNGTTASPSSIVTSASANFQASDLGMTVAGTNIAPGATVTAVDSATTIHISVPTIASASGGVLSIGPGAVTETNPNLSNPSDGSVLAGVHYIFNVIDRSSTGYGPARDLVGFDDVGNGAKSALCSGALLSTLRSNGFLDLAPARSPGGNLGVTCRRMVPS